jgi:hypothetical protein
LLKVHTNDGLTSRVDLEDLEQAEQWLARLKDPKFQASITGLTIAYRGVQYSLPKPQGFQDILFIAEYVAADEDRKVKGGERVFCIADSVRVGLMVHKAQRAVRVTLLKQGKQRWSPLMR